MEKLRKVRILYVDDEQNNLVSFKSAFRRNYEIFTAISASEGMKVLQEQDVHVIIADQRMPHTSGVDFFNIVRAAHPEPVRILLTGFSDIEAVIDAINKGEIFRYIKKPWSEIELKTAIQNAYELYCTRKELKNKIEELQETNDNLNRFVYSISHDLRSPLTSLMGVLNLAALEQSIDDPKGYIPMIEKCVKKMDKFTLKVIEYYKSVRVKNEIENINFETVLADTLEIVKLQNPEIKFQVNVQASSEFFADHFRVLVILDNLISNAVKYYNPEQENPFVNIDVVVDDTAAKIRIEDNGMGILEDHLNKIFQIFFRGDFNLTGLGIGLYIVKEALTRIDGEITVESKRTVGTVFNVTIPNRIHQE